MHSSVLFLQYICTTFINSKVNVYISNYIIFIIIRWQISETNICFNTFKQCESLQYLRVDAYQMKKKKERKT